MDADINRPSQKCIVQVRSNPLSQTRFRLALDLQIASFIQARLQQNIRFEVRSDPFGLGPDSFESHDRGPQKKGKDFSGSWIAPLGRKSPIFGRLERITCTGVACRMRSASLSLASISAPCDHLAHARTVSRGHALQPTPCAPGLHLQWSRAQQESSDSISDIMSDTSDHVSGFPSHPTLAQTWRSSVRSL